LPYPPDPRHPPRRALPDLPAYGGTPFFGWLPGSRAVVLALETAPGSPVQIWEAEVISGKRHAVLGGARSVAWPAVSPDGKKMVFTEAVANYDVVSAPLDGSAPRPLIATDRSEMMPAWAAKQAALVYVTDRNGPLEIWTRSGDADRPVVTPRDFPPGTTEWFMGPALSPEADRVIYTRIEPKAGARLWISALSGGAPVPLTNDALSEFPGSWSPDGAWFTYSRVNHGNNELMKVKTTGQATPVVIKTGIPSRIPSWSPTGEWIALGDDLVSPDGAVTRSLGKHGSPYYMFSADGALVYGIRSEGDRTMLFSVDLDSGAEAIIGDLGRDFHPASGLMPGIRFSLAPDGKTFVYSVGKSERNLWLLEGFASNPGLLARLGLR
jgi:hypothetical protein